MAEGTYALDQLETVQRAVRPVQLGSVQAPGSGGAPAPQLMQAPDVSNPTLDTLLQLGGAAIDNAIKNQQAEKFLEGAQRVAQGEALKDIIDEQPWYTEIFGPSSTVQGARTIAQISQVDEYNNSLYNDMEELQKLTPEEFGAEVRARQKQFLTGDAVADVAIQTKMVESNGPLFQAHTKAHYAWTQGTMQQQVTSMMMQSAASLQAANGQRMKGLMTDADFDQLRYNAAGVLRPLEGQSASSYWSAVESATIDAMANGNHHFAGVVFESGVLSAAPAETRKKLLDARNTYEKRTLEQVGLLEYGNDIAILQAQARAGVISPAQIAERTVAINERARKLTGIQRDMLSRKDMTRMLSSNYGKVYSTAEKARERAAKAGAKAMDEARRQQQILTGYVVGAGQRMVFDGHKKSEVDALIYQANQIEQRGGGNWAGSLVRNYVSGGEYVNPQVRADIQAGLNSAKLEGYNGAPFQNSYNMFQQMRAVEGGTSTAMAYFGDSGPAMVKYDQLVKASIDPAVAYQAAFGEPIDTSRKSNDKELTEKLVSFVDRQQPGTVSQWFGSLPTSSQGQRRVITEVGKSYDMLTQQLNMNDDEAMKVSLEIAKTNLDMLGPYVSDRRAGSPTFGNLIGASEDVASQLFATELARQARKQGVTARLPAADTADAARSVLDVFTAGPIVAAKNEIKRRFGEEADVSVIRVDQFDTQTGAPFAVYNVGVTADGKTTRFLLDSREIRKQYEKSEQFTE